MSKKNKHSSFFRTPSLSQMIRWCLAIILISILVFPPAVTVMIAFVSIIAIMFVVTDPKTTMPTETPRDTPYQKALKRAAQIVVAHYYNIPLASMTQNCTSIAITPDNQNLINAQTAILLGANIAVAKTHHGIVHAKAATQELYKDQEDLEKATRKSRLLCEDATLDKKILDDINRIINHHYHNIIQLADKIVTHGDDTSINPQGLVITQEIIFDSSIKVTY